MRAPHGYLELTHSFWHHAEMSEVVVDEIELFFQEDPSDKVYNARVVRDATKPAGTQHTCRVEWGRRGSNLQQGTKAIGVDYKKAKSAFDKVVRQKTNKGYEEKTATHQPAAVAPAAGHGSASRAGFQSRPQVAPKAQLLNAIDGDDLEGLLKDDDFIAQQKFDGSRLVLILSDGDFIAANRAGQVTKRAAEVERALDGEDDAVFDGELVQSDDGPTYYLFDLLNDAGDDLRDTPYEERYARLQARGLQSDVVQVVKSATGEAEKRALLETLEGNLAEGIVFKKLSAPYAAGRPSSGGDQLKHKLIKSADVVVTENAGNAYRMAVYDGATLTSVGKVFAGTTNDSRADLDRALNDGETPVCEVRYLYATKDDQLYQPVFVRVRSDKDEADCKMDQLIYTDRSSVS